MSTTTIQFKAGTAIELSFATVVEGMEPRIFGEYFPKVMPIVMGHGGKPLGSFAIADAVSGFGIPKMGALFQWPDKGTFQNLHNDQQFLDIKHIRDDALSFFCNGNFFEITEDQEVSFTEGEAFALIAQWDDEDLPKSSSLLTLCATSVSEAQEYKPKRIEFVRWDQKCDDLFETVQASKLGEPEIFKMQFNAPK